MDDAQLQTVWQQRQFKDRYAPVGQSVAYLMKHVLKKRFEQLSELGEIWDEVIPESIRDHTALETYHRGILTVMVDSSPHRYQLQTMLSGGLMKQLRAQFSGAINKVRLIPGQFYSVDISGTPRYEF